MFFNNTKSLLFYDLKSTFNFFRCFNFEIHFKFFGSYFNFFITLIVLVILVLSNYSLLSKLLKLFYVSTTVPSAFKYDKN